MIDRPDLRAQRAYRARRTAKIERLEVECARLIAGHQAILDELKGNDKPVAVRVRDISTMALGEAK